MVTPPVFPTTQQAINTAWRPLWSDGIQPAGPALADQWLKVGALHAQVEKCTRLQIKSIPNLSKEGDTQTNLVDGLFFSSAFDEIRICQQDLKVKG